MAKDTPRISYLKKSIKYYEKLGKSKNLKGYRPDVAVQYSLGVLKAELYRAMKKLKPMYELQPYSNLPN